VILFIFIGTFTHNQRFLWVAFQIQDLCRQTCDADIRTAIAKLPRDLPQTYNRLLSRISNSGKEEIVESIFRWVAATKRPLSLWELREAIAVRPEDIYLNRDRLINNPDGIANWCNNLVVMDEEEEIVQFAHHSIQQFLLSESSDQMTKRFHFSHADADFQAGEICVTYLNFNDFERQLALPPKSSILIQPTDIAKAATGGSSRLTKYLIHLAERKSGIKKPNGAGRDILHFKQTSNETKVDIHDIVRDQYPFLAYASEFWWTHSANLGPAKSRAWTLWKRLLPAENILARKPWIIGKDSVDIACVKGMILSENHLALAASVEDIGIAEADFVNVLLDSIRVENCQVVKSLLNTGLRINASVLALPEGTPFALACLYGNDEIVELFLKKGSEVNGRGELFGAPLKWATRKGHLSVVKLLLDNQADVDAEPKLLKDDFSEIKNPTWARQQRGGAALTIASTYGHTEIAELLINRGANVNRITQLNKECDTALKAASSQGHESIVKLLLDNGAKVDGPRYFTHHANLGLGSPIDALSFASANGNLGIVVRLLDKGAKIEYPWSRFTEFWCSALHAASACGSDSVVELLLQRGARINLPSPKGTALDLAKAFNHTSTAELLVLHGGEQLNPGENEEGDLTYYEAGIPVNLGRNIVGGIIVEDRHIMQEQRSYSSRTPR
jgi:ankyrin repeat protein